MKADFFTRCLVCTCVLDRLSQIRTGLRDCLQPVMSCTDLNHQIWIVAWQGPCMQDFTQRLDVYFGDTSHICTEKAVCTGTGLEMSVR